MTMRLISTITVGSGGASNIEFTAIPQTYTDLLLVLSLRASGAGFLVATNLYLNGVTTGYSSRFLFANGPTGTSVVGTLSGTNADLLYSNKDSSTSNNFSNFSAYIPNYAGSSNKSYFIDGVTENMSLTTGEYLQIISSVTLANTAAVTSITITNTTGITHLENSTVSLYGITKGSDGIVTTS